MRRVLPLLIGLVAIAGVFALVWVLQEGDAASPSAADEGASEDDRRLAPQGSYACSSVDDPGAPRLSVPAGFWSEPFELELQPPSGARTLYYTLDGSWPDPETNPEATLAYDGPLTIDDTSGEAGPLSRIQTSFEKQPDIHPRPVAPGPEWDITRGDQHGGTVVRARADDGPECVGVFFVGDHLRRPELPVVHLSTDEDHLFDHDTGIYVPGETFERWREEEFDGSLGFGEVPANHRQRGREWERPAEDDLERAITFHHFDPGGTLSYQTDLGLRIHGGWTRAFPAKSFRLYARNDYGGRTFDHAFFGDDAPAHNRRLLLRNSGNDWEWTLLLDGYAQSLIHHLDVETQAFQPAVLFINGEYWGIHNLRERYDRHYLEINHGVDPDNVAILVGYGPCCEINTGEEGDEQPFLDLLRKLQDNDPRDDATIEMFAREADLDDLVDYLIVQLYYSNTDWPQNNLKLWREKVEPDPENGTARDGRWRWLVYDLDFVGDLRRDPYHDAPQRLADMLDVSDIESNMGVPYMFARLTRNDGFNQMFLNRFADLLNTTFHPARTVPELDRLAALLEDEVEHHTARWAGSVDHGWWAPRTRDDWEGRIGEVRRYMAERPGFQRVHLVDHFELLSNDERREGERGFFELTVSADQQAGYVTVNTIDIVEDTPGITEPSEWSGHYFRGVPVPLRANPNPGYRFVGWEGLPDGDRTEELVEVTLMEALAVTAVFEPE